MPGQSEVLSIVRMLRPQRSQFRKCRIGSLGDGATIPGTLDYPSMPDRPDLVLRPYA